MRFDQPNYCPQCGSPSFTAHSNKELRCGHCGYRYFHNVAAAVAAMMVCGGEVLLANRAFEPAKGLFDFPGGFVDPDESLESAVIRELEEELGWVPTTDQMQYAFSSFNTYQFADVTYKTVDAFFLIELAHKPQFVVQDDVAFVAWQPLHQIDMATLAFEPMVKAIRALQSTL